MTHRVPIHGSGPHRYLRPDPWDPIKVAGPTHGAGTLRPTTRPAGSVCSLITLLSIQAEQRARKQMMHMGRIQSFLEAMEQFGKVIEVFLNVNNFLAFVWGPIKALLLVRAQLNLVITSEIVSDNLTIL